MKAPTFTIEEYTKRVIAVKEHNKLAIPKDTTIEGNFKMLNKIQQKVNVYDLKEVKEYFDKLGYAKKTIINYLYIILHVVTAETYKSVSKQLKIILEQFNEYLVEVERGQKELMDSKQASTSQKQKSQDLSVEGVMVVIKKLYSEGLIKDGLILELLLDNPCRMEIGTLKYINVKNFMRIEKDNEQNYLVVIEADEEETVPDRIIISRASYKTSDKYGRVDFALENQELTDKLITYIKLNKIHEGSPVFGYTPIQLSKRLFYLTKKHNGGITLSTNAICKIHTTHAVKSVSPTIIEDLKEVDKKLEKIGKKRGTSSSVLKSAYLKD